MSDSENICVCCKHPIVDETIEGDMTLKEVYTSVDFNKLAGGVDSGCRNCAVILDAIAAHVWGEDRSFRQSMLPVHSSPISRGLVIGVDEKIEVIRYSDIPRHFEPSKSGVWNVKECRPLSEDTSSQATIRIIQEWKTNCIQHHEYCMQRLAVPLPKRILEITAEHVFLREQPGSLAPFACLSHCWGSNGPAVKLTAETVGSLREGLKTSGLPKTFRDAVEVCCHLGIHYVWIDALCILQDSEEDWKEAAATMGDIYENSQITLAATASQDSHGGLFSSGRSVTRRLEKHPHLYVRALPDSFPKTAYSTIPESMTLLTRAWVYQERRLSQRTIHFGKHQVYWECQTNFASEDFSENKTWNTYAPEIKDPKDLDWGDKLSDHKDHWQKTVMEYTKLELTYESDRLPAIAAVVARMSRLQRVDDVYIAGLWKNSILSDLMWRTREYEARPARMAPSWSWVSAQNSGVLWDGYEFTQEAKVISLEYTVVGAANLGEVTNASIILMVPVLNLTGLNRYDSDKDCRFRWFDCFEDMSKPGPIMEHFRQNNMEIAVTFFYPDYDLTNANPPFEYGCTIKLLVTRGSSASIGGIVVQQISGNPQEYRRIGFLYFYLEEIEPEMDGEEDEDLAKSDHDGNEEDEEIQQGIDSLILSLPMEEVKII